jgi:hypothetical protein
MGRPGVVPKRRCSGDCGGEPCVASWTLTRINDDQWPACKMPADLAKVRVGTMPRPRTIIRFTVIGAVGLLALVIAAVWLLADHNVPKARLEATASEALGMEVTIGGRMGIAFNPGVLVTLDDVRVHNRGAEVASAKQARLGIELLPLLSREVRIRTIALEQPRIAVERDREGRTNLDTSGAGAMPALDWPSVSVSGGTLSYADKGSTGVIEARDCSLDAHGVRVSDGASAKRVARLAFNADLSCAEVRGDAFMAAELKLSASANNGIVDVKPWTMRLFGTQGSGVARADLSGALPLYWVKYTLAQFQVEEFFKTLSPRKIAAGPMDFSASLSMQGGTGRELRQSAKGQVSLRGRNLTLTGTDLDADVARFESSQNFSLVDLGALFFAGPLGLVLTKGYDFASTFKGSGGSSEVRVLVSEWKVERGVAHAQDVAITTTQNRIALQGGLDFVNNEFDDVSIALVDVTGCAIVRQKIHGTFQNPVVEKPNVLKSLAGPVLRLLRKGGELLRDRECDVFYAGSVAAPR